MSTFFAGNDKLIALAIEATPGTPEAAPTQAWRIFNWTKDPVRAVGPLEESDSSAQQGASHVTAFTPGFSCDLYLRASEFDLIAQGLLGDNDDSGTTTPATHVATVNPDQEVVYFTVWEIEPFATTRYHGCAMVAATLTGQDEGQTEFRVTGLTFLASGVTHGVTEPAGVDSMPIDELPLLYAECTVEYAGVSPGTTSQVTININRNSARIFGDSGFTARAIVHGKLQIDGQVTRYVQDDDTLRAVDTGTEAGTILTTTIFEESFQLAITRGAGGDTRTVQIDIAEIAYETREQVNDYAQGRPTAEVLGFRSQPQADIADHIVITTVNAKPTTEG